MTMANGNTLQVAIVGAARTPIGSYGGILSQTPATILGATAIKGEVTFSRFHQTC